MLSNYLYLSDGGVASEALGERSEPTADRLRKNRRRRRISATHCEYRTFAIVNRGLKVDGPLFAADYIRLRFTVEKVVLYIKDMIDLHSIRNKN